MDRDTRNETIRALAAASAAAIRMRPARALRAATAGEIERPSSEDGCRNLRPRCEQRDMPLESCPHSFFWHGEHVKRVRPEIEDVEILR